MSDELDREMEAFIEQRFYDNLSVIETENKLRINAFVKEQALVQVQMYWKKLRDLAEKVTESEVPITLSNQKSPKGRNFTINGVVDIIKEKDETVLYDIKTHDPDFVRHNKDKYEKQLNLYGSIWEKTHQKKLDRTAVIATPLPAKIRWAMNEGTAQQLEKSLEEWDPIIDLGYDEASRDDTLGDFGILVDRIQDCDFAPPPVDKLKEKMGGGKTVFARKICRNCDIRFACDSYREYSLGRRTLHADDLLYLMKQVGDDNDNQTFRNVSFEADKEKEFEASTREEEIDQEEMR